MPPRRGRPAGLLLNPEALRFALGSRSQAWLATNGKVSTAHLSEMAAGRKGATTEVADRLAAAIGCTTGVLFPEVVQFKTQIRHFVAPDQIEAVA